VKPPTQLEVLAALDVFRRFFASGPAEQIDEWIDAKDAPVPQRTIRDAVRRGEIEATRAGRRLLVRRSELDRWLTERRARPRGTEQPSAVLVQLGARRRGGQASGR
jgi:excisionase family DNA binding protein